MTTTSKIEPVAATEAKTPALKVCHSSVCVGDAHPVNCVCPIPAKK